MKATEWVSREARGLGNGHVRRVEVHEVPALGLLARRFEILDREFDTLKRIRCGEQARPIEDARILVAPVRDVELPAAVYAVQPIVPGSVQVDESGRARRILAGSFGAHFLAHQVVSLFAEFERGQLLEFGRFTDSASSRKALYTRIKSAFMSLSRACWNLLRATSAKNTAAPPANGS